MRSKLAALSLFVLGVSCSKNVPTDILAEALSSKNPKISRVMDNLDEHEIQIRYTQIDRRNDSVIFTDHDFQVKNNNYFYPASTVKFPAAVAALEKLNEVDSLSVHTRFFVEGDSLQTTFAKAISEIFAVSDNAANNRLVEFLGQDDLNRRMERRGVSPIRIAHRLSTDNADDVTTTPLVFYLNDSTTSLSAPIINSPIRPLELDKLKKGKGFISDETYQNGAFDFSLKNYYPIEAQSALLKRIIFPEAFPTEERFNLSQTQQKVLLEAMHTLPPKLGYDPVEYYDSYVKFFMFGDSTEPMPEHIKIYNKVGYAYGTLTDNAYIQDTKNNIDFMLTATILVNSDGVFNDNAYEYDDVGIPFLAQLGREIYELELIRKR
ncbi:class A beta-lactamase-related serine hydrolase [Muricauda oceani]|uniref:Serine hydrolase n=1 Tax=Flagellimonas oceani TaxID=2698672 RepID=A0A6G7IY74_9FLAO|nr:serine hydrolase [Allomuricauda oceani]MBW8243866.1 class A beta-lactamase-related serine hydrolase [Allomuricauda oceani]QII43505.1 serine hydrolase [Allomuricauda oceani]